MGGKKFGLLLAMTALVGAGAIPSATAQTAQSRPVPLVPAAVAKEAYVSPDVTRSLQGAEKGATTRVVVTMNLRAGRSGTFATSDVRTARSSVLSALPAGSYSVVSTFDQLPSISLEIDEASLAALEANPLVASINADSVVRTTMTEANAVTGVASVHAGGVTGSGVTVGIIDTGVDSNAGTVHPALADDLVGQACFRTENDCIGGATSAEDQDGHGTHVAGIITGPEGVAPDANFYALKVFTTGDTSDTNILNALNHVISLNTTTPGTIDIINMSLGGDNFADQATCDANGAAYVTAFASLNAQGVTIFVATGNDADITKVGSPACITGAVGVGSTGDATVTNAFGACTDNAEVDKVSCYSNATPVQGAGELVDLMAPGCSITSTGLDGSTTDVKCGTSMATPYAAGSAALLMEYLADASSAMTPAQIESHMEATGVPISDYRMAPGSPTFPRVSPPAMIGSLALEKPLNFQITGTTATSVSSSWSASAGATEYHVYAKAVGGTPALVGTVTAPTTTFTHSTAACGDLTYFVKAFDGSFESLDSNTDDASARPCPLAPSALTLTVGDADTHTLDWTDNNADETSNVLQRSVNGGAFADYQTVAAGTALTYTDDAVACGIYQYRAVSVRNGDRSAPSNVVQRAVCAPANDDFANAQVVTPDVALTDTEPNQSYATEEATDPIYSCHFGGAAPGFQGVWYDITPTVNTRVTVSTAATTILAPAAGVPDTLIAIYTGTSGSLTEVACNEDISGSNFRSSLSTNLNASTTYHVFVSQWMKLPVGTTGDLVTAFTWTAPLVAPDNDLVGNARVVNSNTYTNTVVNAQFATTSPTDLAHTCAVSPPSGIAPRIGTHTLWWTFTPSADGTVDLDTLSSSGSFTDTIMTVYTGTPGAFTVAACNDDETSADVSFRSEILDLAVTGGTTYTIYVSRWSNSPTTTAGTVVLDVNFTVAPRVIVSPSTVDVTEGGATDSYTMELATAPTADVTVAVTGDDDCSVDDSELVFTAVNWNVAQTVTVTADDDHLVEGSHSCTIGHTATSADAAYNGLTIASVVGSVTDGTPPGVTVSPNTVDVTEGGATDSYSVVLQVQPFADVTIAVASDADCSVDDTELVFTSANWNTAQTVTVTAVDDHLVEGSHSCTIGHTATSSDVGYDGLTIASVVGSVTDGTPPGVTVSPNTVDVTEGGATDSYTLVLNTQPLDDVTIVVAGDADCSVNDNFVVFTAANWNVAQTVTVTAVDDHLVEGSHSCAIGHGTTSGDGGYNGLTVALVTGTVTDGTPPGVTVSPSTVAVTEGGATDSYTVVLQAQPLADVTIAVAGDADCSVDDTELVFTAVNWNVAQTVTVTAVDDLLAEGAHSCTIGHTATSSDVGYDGVSVASVTGTVTDHSYPAGVTLTKVATTSSLPEPGGAFQFTITIENTSTVPVEITALTDDDTLSSACQALVGITIGGGGTANCTTSVTHTTVGTYTPVASVTVENAWGNTDTDTASDTVEVTDVVPVDGDVIVTVTASPDPIPESGATVTFTVTIDNGSSQAVTIDELLGASVTSLATIQATAQCATAVSTVLQPGDTYTCTFTEFVSGEFDNGPVQRTVSVVVSDAEGNSLTTSRTVDVTLTEVLATTTTTNAPTTTIRRGIPATGGSFSNTLVVAGGLVLIGGALVLTRRRRRPVAGLR